MIIFLSLVLNALLKGKIILGNTGKTLCGALIIKSEAPYWANLRTSISLSDSLQFKDVLNNFYKVWQITIYYYPSTKIGK